MTQRPRLVELIPDVLRLGHAAVLEHDPVVRDPALLRYVQKVLERVEQLVGNATARATVGQLDRVRQVCSRFRFRRARSLPVPGPRLLPPRVPDQLGIDVDRGHVVDDAADFEVRLREHVAKERRLARAQESGQHAHRDGWLLGWGSDIVVVAVHGDGEVEGR